MLRRGMIGLAVAAGLFGTSAAAGFLLANGALRHSANAVPIPPAALAPRSAAGQPPTAPGLQAAATGSSPGEQSLAPGPAPAGTATGASADGGSAPAPLASAGPTAQPRPAPAPPAAPAPAAPATKPQAPVIPGRVHVQVASFPERQNADALAIRLRAGGYAVTVTDGPPYRVWVGGYLDPATAERLAAHLKDLGFSPELVPQ